MSAYAMNQSHKPRANKARLDNRWGCSVGQALRNFNPPSRLHAHSRPGGRHSLDVRRRYAHSYTEPT